MDESAVYFFNWLVNHLFCKVSENCIDKKKAKVQSDVFKLLVLTSQQLKIQIFQLLSNKTKKSSKLRSWNKKLAFLFLNHDLNN